ncbi:MAG: BrnT family toxin [Gammaproteobacteria bacterium]
MALRFEWDRRKAAGNLRKHGVSFDEASTVFDDPLARIFDDEDHSEQESREIIVGHSAAGRLLLVLFTEPRENVIKIISARPATPRERDDYEENQSH